MTPAARTCESCQWRHDTLCLYSAPRFLREVAPDDTCHRYTSKDTPTAPERAETEHE